MDMNMDHGSPTPRHGNNNTFAGHKKTAKAQRRQGNGYWHRGRGESGPSKMNLSSPRTRGPSARRWRTVRSSNWALLQSVAGAGFPLAREWQFFCAERRFSSP